MGNKLLAICLVVNLLAVPQAISAQGTAGNDKSNWEVLKAIPPGDELVVKAKNGKTEKGRFSSVSDDFITIARGKKTVNIKREDVVSIHRVLAKSATRASLIGLAIGGGAGGVSGGVYSKGGESGENFAVLILGGLGAGIGAVTGYLIGSRKQRILIYEATK